MSINSVLLSGLSGLRASQTTMGIISQNIANANTAGYVRTEVSLSPLTNLGSGGGVNVASIHRAADRFLATASYIAEAARGASTARAAILSRAQANFGDPNTSTSMFAMLDDYWSALTEVGIDPSSSLRRDDAVNALQAMFGEVQRVGQSIQGMITEADQRIADAVAEAQSLINRIAELNKQIRLTNGVGADSSAAQNAQSALIDELSAIMDVRASPSADGGVTVRTGGGALLVGVDPARLTYTPNNASFANHGVIQINADLGSATNLEPYIVGGEIAGLLQVRDQDLPALAEAMGGFAAALGDALNEVHNQNSSWPAVDQLVGRQTGLLGSDSLGFSGSAIVGVVDAGGALRQRLTIDFDAGTITAEAPAGVFNFNPTIDDFADALNDALAAATPAGSASFTDGVLQLDVGGNGGLVVQQDPADEADRAGRGFSHFFGLNDIVARPNPMFFETGIEGGDAHGFQSGGAVTYEIMDSAGRYVGQRTIEITGALAAGGSDWDDLIGALNDPTDGLGTYGTFALDADGRLGFTPAIGYEVGLVSDSTRRGATGVSMTSLHGLSPQATAGRALEINVDSELAADPGRLAVGRPDLTLGIGAIIVEAGDNRGSAALLAARDTVRTFPSAGALSGQTTTLATYAARLAGEAGRLSADAERAKVGATAIATAAADRRSQAEGVNLDDELIKMTTYQNSYAAAARVIQAATEMFDVLLAIGYR